MANCGFSEEEAKRIEANYHELYQVSDAWTKEIVTKARTTGFVPLAFGGRIRTPLLAKTAGSDRTIPYSAKAEERSAGNAATQSYCILTLRAFNEFMGRVWASPYIYDILPSCTIHDAAYITWRDSAKITKWVNDNLIDCMRWQDLPELKHDTITMSSEMEIFWPSWANGIELPNDIEVDEIKSICNNAEQEYRTTH